MNSLTTTTTTNDTSSRTWTISLTILCVAIVAYMSIYPTNNRNDLAFLLEYNLATGLIIWAIFQAIIGRKQGLKSGWLSFLAIFVAFIGGSLVGFSQQRSAETLAITEIKKSYSFIKNAANDDQGIPQHIAGNLDVTPKANGEFGEVERYIKVFMNKLIAQRNDYLRELDAIGWDNILDLSRVSQDRNLTESKMKIKKANDIVRKYKSQMYTLIDNTRNDIKNLNINESSKGNILHSFDKGVADSRAQIDSMWDLESKTISEFEKIFSLLAARKGAWVIQNGQILFTVQSDLDAFTSYLTAIKEFAARQQDIQKQGEERLGDR